MADAEHSVPYDRNRNCPVCGGYAPKLLFAQRFESLSNGILSGYDLCVCTICGAGYADHIPPQDVFDAYYRDASKYEYHQRAGTPSPADEKRFEETAELLSKEIGGRKTRVLEIGCATGSLLSKLKKMGFENLVGVDPSPACAEIARRQHGLEAFAHTIFDMPKFDGGFDFVIFIGVLEHIENVNLAIGKLAEVLVPQGRAFVEVPDASRLGGLVDAPYQEFSVEHINFFSCHSLNNAMQMRGFRTLSSGELLRPQNERTTVPAAYGFYEKTGQVEKFVKDDTTEKGLSEYIRASEKVDRQMRSVIEATVSSAQPIIVWGVGTHTQRLLATNGLDRANIVAFVDSNTKYQGRSLHGLPVLSPDSLKQRSEPILISSRGFQNEIESQIRNTLGLKNPVIKLYQ